MKCGKIRSVTVPNYNRALIYALGDSWPGIPIRRVSKIEDRSIEYSTHIHLIYQVLDQNDYLIAEIQNCPMIINYDQPEEKDEESTDNKK